MEKSRFNFNHCSIENKFTKNALEWSEYMQSLHHLLDGGFIFSCEYNDIRERLIDRFCKGETDAGN